SQSPPMADKPVYFPALNAIRAYAAIAVLIAHAEQIQRLLGISTDNGLYAWLGPHFPNAPDSVTLFFVLSGFLITYLLLVEKQRTGTVAVGKFYARRCLRIWPLYYLVFLLGFVVLPLCLRPADYAYIRFDQDYAAKFGLFACMLGNVSLSWYAAWPLPVAH